MSVRRLVVFDWDGTLMDSAPRIIEAVRAATAASGLEPRMLRELLARLDVAPRAAVMVGDTLFDLEMARRAGVPAVAVSWGAHAPQRLAAAGPEALIDTLAELPAWLTRIPVGAPRRGPPAADPDPM